MYRFSHMNFNVLDLDKSLAFYQEALGLHELRRQDTPQYTIVFMGDDEGFFALELTWLKDRTAPYNLGDEEYHLAFETPDMASAHALHEKMGCICYENKERGIYFLKDPDGYWLEIIPLKKR